MSRIITTITRHLKPFAVPNFVACEPPRGATGALPDAPANDLHLRELPTSALDELLAQFQADVYESAGRKPPQQVASAIHAAEARAAKALRRLVELKDGPRGADYERAKEAAWRAARTALSDLDAWEAPHAAE